MPEVLSAGFWWAVGQIILIDLVLSGDNAVVIALACRNLPERQRRQGVLCGVAGAVVLRVVLTFCALSLLLLPGLKFLGGLLLLWIAVKLLHQEDSEGAGVLPAASLSAAVRTIVLADFVMSLDNVIGVAAAARGSQVLIAFGLAVSIPLIVWSSQLVMRMMARFPAIVTGGAALLGWVAGEMIVSDTAIRPFLADVASAATVAALAGALLVVAVGRFCAPVK